MNPNAKTHTPQVIPPAGSNPSKKGKQQNPNVGLNYPTVSLSLVPLQELVPFQVDFHNYLKLADAVYYTVIPLLSRGGATAFKRHHFLEFCLFLLAKRLFDVLHVRPTLALPDHYSPVVTTTNIPRPLYTYLASIGDIYDSDNGLHRIMDVSYADVKALTHKAIHIGETNDDDTPNLTMPVTETNAWLQFSSIVNVEYDQGGFNLTNDPNERFWWYKTQQHQITDTECNTLDAWLQGLFSDQNNLPLTPLGSYTGPPPVQDVFGRATPIANRVHRALVALGDNAFHAFRPVVDFSAVAGSVHRAALHSAMSLVASKYNCAAGLPTSKDGSNALLARVSTSERGWTLSSPRAMAPTYCAVAYACRFQSAIAPSALAEPDGFSSTVVTEDPDQVCLRWITSNIKH